MWHQSPQLFGIKKILKIIVYINLHIRRMVLLSFWALPLVCEGNHNQRRETKSKIQQWSIKADSPDSSRQQLHTLILPCVCVRARVRERGIGRLLCILHNSKSENKRWGIPSWPSNRTININFINLAIITLAFLYYLHIQPGHLFCQQSTAIHCHFAAWHPEWPHRFIFLQTWEQCCIPKWAVPYLKFPQLWTTSQYTLHAPITAASKCNGKCFQVLGIPSNVLKSQVSQ